MLRSWTRTVTIEVVTVQEVEVEVRHYAGSPPTLTDAGEPAETTCSEAHDVETEMVVELSSIDEDRAITKARAEEQEAYDNSFNRGPKPF